MTITEIIKKYGNPDYVIIDGHGYAWKDIEVTEDGTKYKESTNGYTTDDGNFKRVITERIFSHKNTKIVYVYNFKENL